MQEMIWLDAVHNQKKSRRSRGGQSNDQEQLCLIYIPINRKRHNFIEGIIAIFDFLA